MVSYNLKNERYGKVILPVCKELGISKQYQFDALVSLCYNVGNDVLTGRKSKVYRTLKASLTNEPAIRQAFGEWVHGDGGQVLPGLVARRNDEVDMFFGRTVKYRDVQNLQGGIIPNGGWLPEQ